VITVLYLFSYDADKSAWCFSLVLLLIWLFWDLKPFIFFIAFIIFLGLSSLGISQFRQAESVPRGCCGVTAMRVICVVYCRARRWRERGSYHGLLS